MVARKIFATNYSTGGAQAIVPVLRRLVLKGHSIIVCGLRDDPGFLVLRNCQLTKDIYELTEIKNELIQNIFKKEKVDVVVIGRSGPIDTTDKLSIAIANQFNIPTILIDDTWPYPNLSNLSEEDDFAIPLYKTLSRVCVIDEAAKNIFVKAGFDSAKVIATGNPALDNLAKIKAELPNYRMEMRLKFGLDSNALVICYALTDELEDEVVRGPYYGLRAEKIVLEEFLSAASLAKELGFCFKVIVSQKSSFRAKIVREAIMRYYPLAIFDNEVFFDGLAPVLAADVVVGRYTTVLEKAAILGIPTISYVSGRNLDSDPIFTNRCGITVPFYKERELSDFILNVARAPICAVEDLKKMINPVSLPQDATGNVVQEILALCD